MYELIIIIIFIKVGKEKRHREALKMCLMCLANKFPSYNFNLGNINLKSVVLIPIYYQVIPPKYAQGCLLKRVSSIL